MCIYIYIIFILKQLFMYIDYIVNDSSNDSDETRCYMLDLTRATIMQRPVMQRQVVPFYAASYHAMLLDARHDTV